MLKRIVIASAVVFAAVTAQAANVDADVVAEVVAVCDTLPTVEAKVAALDAAKDVVGKDVVAAAALEMADVKEFFMANNKRNAKIAAAVGGVVVVYVGGVAYYAYRPVFNGNDKVALIPATFEADGKTVKEAARDEDIAADKDGKFELPKGASWKRNKDAMSFKTYATFGFWK